MEVDRPLTRDHVVETRVGADRVRVCRSAGADGINLFLRPRPGPGRPLYLTGESGTNAYTRDDDCAHRSRKQGLRAHVLSPFLSNGLLLAPKKLVSRRHGVNRRYVGPKDELHATIEARPCALHVALGALEPSKKAAREQDEPGAGFASELPTRSARGLRQTRPELLRLRPTRLLDRPWGELGRSSPWARAPLFGLKAWSPRR